MADKTAVAQVDLTLSRDLGAGNTESYSVSAGESFDFSALSSEEQESLKERDLVKFEGSAPEEEPAGEDEELTRDEDRQAGAAGIEDPKHSDQEDVVAASSDDDE